MKKIELTKISKNNFISGNTVRKMGIITRNMNLYSTHNHWVMLDNNLYFFKEENDLVAIIAELVSERLCQAINLECVQNKMVYYDTENGPITGLLSPNFRKKNVSYLSGDDLTWRQQRGFQGVYNFERAYPLALKSILKLIILDIYSGQCDRNSGNILFYKKNNDLKMAPAFDFEDSFIISPICYDSYMFFLNYERDLQMLVNIYPELKEYISILLSLDIKTIIEEITSTYEIEHVPEMTEDFINVENRSKKLLKKFVR